MLHKYYTIIGCRYEANSNIANGNPILSSCGLTRERQRQYRQWETNVGPIYSCCLGCDMCGYNQHYDRQQTVQGPATTEIIINMFHPCLHYQGNTFSNKYVSPLPTLPRKHIFLINYGTKCDTIHFIFLCRQTCHHL